MKTESKGLSTLLTLVLGGAGLVALSATGCAAAPTEAAGTSAQSSQSLTEEEAIDAAREACHGAYANEGLCVACVAHAQPRAVPTFATGECRSACIATTCALEGQICGTLDDCCGGSLSCGRPCDFRTFEVTCTERTFGCDSPVGDVFTTTTLDVDIALYPTLVPPSPLNPVATGTVIVDPRYTFILGGTGALYVTAGPVGSLEGIDFRPFASAGYLGYASYAVDRTTMTFSSTGHRHSRGTCGTSGYSGIHKTCTGVVKP